MSSDRLAGWLTSDPERMVEIVMSVGCDGELRTSFGGSKESGAGGEKIVGQQRDRERERRRMCVYMRERERKREKE